MTISPGRPLRADAERNRVRLLDAAAETFATQGLDASAAAVARAAGVGQGTVFRHFPTKDDLVAAVLAHRIDELAAAAASASDLRAFMEAFVEAHLHDLCLFEAATGLAVAHPEVRTAQERLFGAIERVAAVAHAAGELREDVQAVDLPFLVLGVSHAAALLASAEPEIWRRYLGVVLDGLRPGGSPLPVAAPSLETVDRVCAAKARLDASRKA